MSVRAVGLALVLVLLGTSTLLLVLRSQRLERRLAAEEARLETLARLLEPTSGRLASEPLDQILDELRSGVADARQQLEAIQDRLGAAGRVVREAASATVLLQGAYGFRDPETGQELRLVPGPDGRPVAGTDGQPLVQPGGGGPPFERFYTGTGFLVSGDGLLLTNRHVAQPWEFDPFSQRLVTRGLVPVLRRLVGYLPDQDEPISLTALAHSERADVSLLRCECGLDRPFLELSDTAPDPADEVIVLGYPLGIRALMARTRPDFLEELTEAGESDFWSVARRLSEGGYVAPLATRGIVGQRTDRFIVYDAETTTGGSGGPVLSLDGRVVAVNSAILPEFGGSNLGVPAAEAAALLEQADPRPTYHRE